MKKIKLHENLKSIRETFNRILFMGIFLHVGLMRLRFQPSSILNKTRTQNCKKRRYTAFSVKADPRSFSNSGTRKVISIRGIEKGPEKKDKKKRAMRVEKIKSHSGSYNSEKKM